MKLIDFTHFRRANYNSKKGLVQRTMIGLPTTALATH
jgi:hypothetical protein